MAYRHDSQNRHHAIVLVIGEMAMKRDVSSQRRWESKLYADSSRPDWPLLAVITRGRRVGDIHDIEQGWIVHALAIDLEQPEVDLMYMKGV